MISDKDLAEWEHDARAIAVCSSLSTELALLASECILPLIAEVRRLTASRNDWHARYEQAQEYIDGPGRDIVDNLRGKLTKVTAERDAMRDVVASVRVDLDKIDEGACRGSSFLPGCSGDCEYIARAALAKLDAVKS